MIMIKKLLASVAIMALLGACANSTQPVTTQVASVSAQAQTDIQTLAASLPAMFTALQATGTMTTAQAAQFQSDVSTAQSAAGTLASMSSIPTNSSTLSQFFGILNDALAVATVVAPANPIVLAASVIVPIAETGVTLVASQMAAAPVLPNPTMTPTQARIILAGAAKR
jgi:hypothetical protein